MQTRQVVALVTVIAIIALALGGISTTGHGAINSTSSETPQTTTSLSASLVSASPGSAMQTSNNGLQLNATLSTVSLAEGGNLTISIEAFNTLSSYNNVSWKGNWAFQSLIGPCKGGLFNDALYSGFYTSSNISSATPLPWNPPGIPYCPPSGNYAYYSFDPNSDIFSVIVATPAVSSSSSSSSFSAYTQVYTSCSLNNQTSTMSDGSTVTSYSTVFCITSTSIQTPTPPTPASSSVNPTVSNATAISSYQVNGYYDASLSEFVQFAPGEYSLLVGGIWGGYVILHFEVS